MTGDSAAYNPRWSNCLFWAAHQLHHHGGYGLIRRGHNGVPFHVLWSPDHVDVYSYEPITSHWAPGHWRSDLLIFFKGQVVRGDEPPSLRGLYPGAAAVREMQRR